MTSALPLTRLVPIIARAVAVLGDQQKVTHWMTTPLAPFDNRPPWNC
jgi:uncharacterized protein (DUF2384 family)